MPSAKAELTQWNDGCEAFDAKDYKLALLNFEVPSCPSSTFMLNTESFPPPTHQPISQSARIHFNMAIAFRNLQKEEKAIACLTRAIALDKYLAVAYFVRGALFFKREQYSEALADYSDALKCMRSTLVIDYSQLGLAHKLYAYQISFNRGLTYSALNKINASISDFDEADNTFCGGNDADQTLLHDRIDQAVDLGKRACDYVGVYSVDYKTAIYKPAADKVENMKKVDYLGQSKVVAGADSRDAYAGFSGTLVKSEQKLVNKGPLDSEMRGSLPRSKTLTDQAMDMRRKDKADIARAVTLNKIMASADKNDPIATAATAAAIGMSPPIRKTPTAGGGGRPDRNGGGSLPISARSSSLLMENVDYSRPSGEGKRRETAKKR
ncbi:hypothetical protein HDU83_004469 [Entophlyctis luteolus]|nr:hypothetical protein HDU83_004469 [Entophlyctis luteolus]